MKCVILQPSYIPWRGYFHQIAMADVFVFYDDVKYDKNGWRNRNRIKTPSGTRWITIPVLTAGLESRQTPIREMCIDWSRNWNKVHWNTLTTYYARAPHFDRYAPLLEPFYAQRPVYLADFTIELTIFLARQIGIRHTQFVRSSTLPGIGGQKTARLIQLLTRLEADHYISGPSARDYLDEECFERSGIRLEYMRYDYPEYEQLYPPYDPQVSILDLLFMTGPQALAYILGSSAGAAPQSGDL